MELLCRRCKKRGRHTAPNRRVCLQVLALKRRRVSADEPSMRNKKNTVEDGSESDRTGALSLVLMGTLVVVIAIYVILRIF